MKIDILLFQLVNLFYYVTISEIFCSQRRIKMLKKFLGLFFLLLLLFFFWNNELLWSGLKNLLQTQLIQQLKESKELLNIEKAIPKVIINQPLPSKSKKLSLEDINKVEHAVLDLINQDRQKNGLSPVIWDETAANAARQHVQE